MLDANCKLGYTKDDNNVWISGAHESVGACEPEYENPQGMLFREWLAKARLCAANTFFPTGKTFFGCNNHSRIDYILTIQDFITNGKIKLVETLPVEAMMVSAKPTSRPRDHVPVRIVFDPRHFFDPSNNQKGFKWNRDDLVRACVVSSSKANLFRSALSDWSVNNQERFSRVVTGSLEDSYDLILEGIDSCGKEIFHCDPVADVDGCSSVARRKLRIALLKKRNMIMKLFIEGCKPPYVREVFLFWSVTIKLHKTQLLLKATARLNLKIKRKVLQAELAEAWSKRKLHEAWRLSRMLACGKNSVKNHGVAAFAAYKPTDVEWIEHNKLSGKLGGNASTNIDPEVLINKQTASSCPDMNDFVLPALLLKK